MSDYGDSDDDYDDQEWLYVEDHYDEADDLAEHTCPSPGYQDPDVFQEYDPYDYWEDLAYLSDGVYDIEERHAKKRKVEPKVLASGTKRKRVAQDGGGRWSKRLRADGGRATLQRTSRKRKRGTSPEPVVVWKSQGQPEDVTMSSASEPHIELTCVSLLKDWKERFGDKARLPIAQFSEVADDEAEADPSGIALTAEGFNLADPQSIAALLSGDNLDALKKILKAQGLDPDAVEVVLQDLIEGKEREFSEEDEGEGEGEDTGDEAGEEEEEGQEQNHVDNDTAHLQLVAHSAADQAKEYELASTLHATDTPPKENGTAVVRTMNGSEGEFSLSRAVGQRDSIPQKKRRKVN